MDNLHVSGGCFYLDNRLVIPACLRSTMLHRLHESHPGQFAMKSLATQYIFITNMRNVEIQKKLCIEYLTPENVLSYVLVHEKGTKIHQQYLKIPTYNAVQRPQYIKIEPTLNIVENNKCRNCSQQFKKGHLTSCPARDRN